ncbi:MAG: hypothetical protein ACHQAY_06445 [Hyphomicrobiales bacterium]
MRRDVDFNDDVEPRDDYHADDLISAAVAEAKRHVRRNELKTNSALDAISDWIEKSEVRRTDDTKRLASSQERMASAVRDALGLMTSRLDQIESLVTEAPSRAFEPIRSALGRLDDRVSAMEDQQSTDQRHSQQFSSMMDSLGKRLSDVVGKIDELADARSRDDPALREERIAGIEAKLGSILQQLSRPSPMGNGGAPSPRPASPAPVAARPKVVLRSVTNSGKLDAAVEDIRRKRDALGGAPEASIRGRATQPPMQTDAALGLAGLRAELGALAIQLQRLEKGRIDAESLNELLATTSEVRRLLADPAMPRLAARIEQGVADLTRRVDALTMKVVDREEIAALTAAISEIRAKLSEPRSGVDAGVVERRIEALSAKIDEVMREPLGLVGQHLADLSARLGTSPRTAAPDDAMTEIRDKLDRIVERGDLPSTGQAPSGDSGALAEVRDRLDRLSAQLDHAPERADSGTIADLRARLEQLAASIEQSATNAPDKIDRVLRQIAANIDVARQQDPNPGALQALERQVAALAERVGGDSGSTAAIADLEHSLTRLFDELAAIKAAAVTAAEAAASGAVSQGTEANLALRQERAEKEREMHSTLDQMHTLLERIMGRLSSLEEQAHLSAQPDLAGRAAETTSAAPAQSPAGRALQGAAAPAAANPDEDTSELDAFEAAALEAARSVAARSGQRVAGKEAAVMPVAVSHEPLEPGSGRPMPAAAPQEAMARAPNGTGAGASGGARPLAGDLSAAVGSGGAMSAQALIAAARRAAADTAARQKAASSPASSLGTAKNALSSLKASAGAHRKPILLALIGLMVVYSAVGAGRLILGSEPSSIDQGARPASPQAPASGAPRPTTGADSGASKPPPAAPGDAPGAARPSGAAPAAPGRSSSLPTPPAFTKLGQTITPAGDGGDVSRPANDVTGSVAAPAAAATLAKPGAVAPIAAAPGADPTTAPDFIARLKLAANADDPIGEYELAARMYEGRGMARDPQGAAKLFERAANLGLVPAQYRIANIYETGIGAAKDLVLARAWFEKAADHGNAKAMHNVGVYLAQGIQGKPDYATAVTWFRRAAERNVRDSQYNLAILLARGLGAPRDFKASYVWFALAARDGDADSAKKRDEIASRLSTAELDDAKAAVASWKPIEVDRSANEVDVKNIKWDRVGPAPAKPDPAKTSKL